MNDTLAQILGFSAPVLLIGSVVVVSVLGWVIPPLYRALLLNPYRVAKHGEIHRLITGGWVHKDVMHLAFNMFTLYFFAEQTARVLGAPRFVILYVSAVVAAFVPTVVRHRGNPGYNSLGASGAVAAVMFSAILLHPKLRLQLMFLPVPVSGIVFAGCYLAYSAYRSWSGSDGVNHGAHFSGAVYGSVLTYLFEPARVERTLRALL
jgi:membrane associated rhomboid family serine protease